MVSKTPPPRRVAFRGLADGVNVVERYADETFHQRAKAGVDFGVAVADMVAIERPWKAFHRPRFAVSQCLCPRQKLAQFSVRPRWLAGLQQKNTLYSCRQLRQLRCQLFLAGYVVVVGAVDELGNLLARRARAWGGCAPGLLTAMPPRASDTLLPFTSHTRQPWPRSVRWANAHRCSSRGAKRPRSKLTCERSPKGCQGRPGVKKEGRF